MSHAAWECQQIPRVRDRALDISGSLVVHLFYYSASDCPPAPSDRMVDNATRHGRPDADIDGTLATFLVGVEPDGRPTGRDFDVSIDL